MSGWSVGRVGDVVELVGENLGMVWEDINLIVDDVRQCNMNIKFLSNYGYEYIRNLDFDQVQLK